MKVRIKNKTVESVYYGGKKVKDLKGSGVWVRFGPISDPERYELDLLKEARRRLSLGTIDFDECILEPGDRLGEPPYSDTGRARGGMPSTYLCEGSVWLDFISPDDKKANISFVPHLDTVGDHADSHASWFYWANFDGSTDSRPLSRQEGHRILKGEPMVISMICGKDVRKGTIDSES